jgi:hypothetical protein
MGLHGGQSHTAAQRPGSGNCRSGRLPARGCREASRPMSCDSRRCTNEWITAVPAACAIRNSLNCGSGPWFNDTACSEMTLRGREWGLL